MSMLTINKDRCQRDGACIDCCPYGLIVRDAAGFPVSRSEVEGLCIRCGHCVAVCGAGALANHFLDDQVFQPLADLDRAADPLAFAMRTRRSVRGFQQRPVERWVLKDILDVARYAPTANNSQKLWWVVVLEQEQMRRLAELAKEWMRQVYFPDHEGDVWPPGVDPVLRGAPHLLLCCAPADYPWAATDCAIAATHVDLLASARGLGTCWAGVFLRAAEGSPALAEALALPPGQKAYSALMLGHPRYDFTLVPPRKPLAVDWR